MKSRNLQRLDEQLAVYRHSSDNVDLILTAYSLFAPPPENGDQSSFLVSMSIVSSFDESNDKKKESAINYSVKI
ncbi:hypothetical protein BBC0178_014360 [Bartonella apihabitans]|uniref:Uncharacterized protein n=1 Tax=Bartonella apihabitans TaxID=2750929 RepID=A0A1U9MBT0_9HYPH|nr:hypothetical protein [Bartonella apihabitans]AQT42901.1 hypothetical protein BBC0178_014360 [Bartonella apihabitans]